MLFAVMGFMVRVETYQGQMVSSVKDICDSYIIVLPRAEDYWTLLY